MSGYLCPQGHESAETDFCSICGAKMRELSPTSAPVCPDCGAKREPTGATFCEICGYNFSTGAHGELKPAREVSSELSGPPVGSTPSWELVVTVDPALRAPGSPEPPATFEPLVVRVHQDMTLIGRTSERRGIFPDLPLDHDDAVSHRHALLGQGRTPPESGTLVLRDVGSSNGTALNGNAVPALIDTPIKDGDIVTLGHWTRIAVRSVQ